MIQISNRRHFTLHFVLFLWFTLQCFHGAAQNGEVYENKKYDKAVGVVQLYPILNVGNQEMQPPIVHLQQTTELMLQFDMLTEEYDNLQAKIIHCNADWTQSVLNDIEFLYDYNTFDLRDFDYSENTLQLYVNYWMKMPKVKVSGNYIVQVYHDSRPDEVVLTRRFIVYEQLVNLDPGLRSSTSVRYRQTNQQIDFALSYPSLQVNNPMSDFKIVLLQNHRWDNAVQGLLPTSINQAASKLEYRHFNAENNFRGGNEFRFFDIRVYNFRGMNVGRVDKGARSIDAYVMRDKSRNQSVYSHSMDMNGSFYITTNEAAASYLQADYINVHFDLAVQKIPEDIYVIGAFNNWRKDQFSRLTYNAQSQSYQAETLLKQGFYDYMYWVDGENPYRFEGSFYQTQNDYEIIVYYRGFTDLADRVVGYTSVETEF
ncbi:type IX secretion system plug protein domain-containing protein [Reichenbachiella agariperforans]|uniref:Type 9 secretion system plug protein N-terminal domain-containing protein n=1 Tax=Reichenbachiella agariperforans TaxID=156994 RepID=A0A1M6WC38_REIAG|nr:type IX secretion system plug protein domain-containing protein [Reichenbachiella agariperforans]MBU2915159.1 DUF5103 domain-containing protein [Reichenbachiella agariperforans]SHK91307.1 protein of unknown function [Reichenbachiella agariperforans]